MMSSPESEQRRVCARCNREIAQGQHIEHRGAIYCTECVGKALNGEAPGHSIIRRDVEAAWREAGEWLSVRRETGYRNATLAVILSLVPGLGQMYNGQMRKGVVVLGGFLVLATGGLLPILGGLLHAASIAVIYFWNLFDAYWTAERINRGEMGEVATRPPPVQPAQPAQPPQPAAAAPATPAPAPEPEPARGPSGALAGWGVFLIILGVLFLLNNFGTAWMTWDRLWPAALLAFGVWLLASFALSRRQPRSPEPPSEETRNG
jgi:TM2 domain-containing membrane protein YozV/DNA-directed RNA polymerase subunit RPC12/RpoP